MTFVYPYLFWILIVPFILFAILISTNKEKLSRVFDERVLKRLSASDEAIPLVMRNITIFAAIFLMIVALARPVIEKGEKVVDVKGLNLVVGLDISGSMRSTDLYPNRLEFAKKKIFEFFEAMPSDEISVLAFAHSSFILAPFSADKQTLQMMVEGVDDSYMSMGSTDFSELGMLASEVLEKKEPKIVVLFTDGGDEAAIAGFADILEEHHIDLYVVLVGTTKGSPVLTQEGKPYMLEDGTIAITQRNDALLSLARKSGGDGIVAGHGKEDIRELAARIKNKYQDKQQGEVRIKERVELFYYPLGAGLLLLLIALSSIPRRSVQREK
ncbi:MAG: VWA domain-containing protein [Sulfurovum sp.]|nr:VWA domain-containing protein [Sulfurovum sp.]